MYSSLTSKIFIFLKFSFIVFILLFVGIVCSVLSFVLNGKRYYYSVVVTLYIRRILFIRNSFMLYYSFVNLNKRLLCTNIVYKY